MGLNHSIVAWAKASAVGLDCSRGPPRPCRSWPMDTQTELARLRAEIAELRKALGDKQLPAPTLPSLIDDEEFCLLMAKFSDGLASEESIRKRFRLSDADWERLGRDDALVEKIELLRAARVKSGATRREKAQQYVVAAVDTVNGVVADPRANARHRLDGAGFWTHLPDSRHRNPRQTKSA